MSGITPILDTLLHQVLGKRVDVPLARELPLPVRPLQPGQAPPAVHSDSRLDPRPAPTSDSARGAATGERPAGAPTTPAAPPAGGSTRTHFSAAARTIGDLLSQYPAPPSALRPSAPLLAVGEAAPAEVAARLRGSLEHSGLFYESHLQGWFRGERSLEQLAREPQMRLFRDALAGAGLTPAPARERSGAAPASSPPLPSASAPAASPPAAPSQSASGLSAPASPLSSASAEAGLDDGGRPAGDAERGARPLLPEGHREALHGVLRHQLELLATPVLRWEGDVWSGLFMALVVQVPPRDTPPRGQSDGGGSRSDDEPAPPWRSELTLSLATLGEVRVRLALTGQRLDLDLTATEDTARRLRAGGQRLRERLAPLMEEGVTLTIHESRDHD
ncbi:flagellar hook-length control protein FliK [Alloalcanivorax sp. C16-1]|uniref:flagellar hook-length control protein FliK n=1 Tax=Alloalcanivorax sp. C16-1 TaxID=3390051 RepID=UPI00397069C6